MLTYVSSFRQNLRLAALVSILPLAFWASLWLGIGGARQGILSPQDPVFFLRGIFGFLPLVAGGMAACWLIFKLRRQSGEGRNLVGPLGLTVVYGLVGFFATIMSPNILGAMYWAGVYLAVPVLLWALVGHQEPLSRLREVIEFNRLAIVLGSVIFFCIALAFLDLGRLFADPSLLLKCELPVPGGEKWFNFTLFRGTGVGRFAALASIISLGAIWRGHWKPLWTVLLLGFLVLLITSGARTAMIAFAPASLLIMLLHGGKKAALITALGLTFALAVLWSTNLLVPLLNDCLFDKRGNLHKAQPAIAELPSLTTDPSLSTDPSLTTGGTDQSVGGADGTGKLVPEAFRATPSFFTMSGRTRIWAQGWELFQQSPVIGFGFHADRFVLERHMSNSVMHALVQTGLLGTIALVSAILWAWFLLLKSLTRLHLFSRVDKCLVIEMTGLLVFLSLRSVAESPGAFFGVDWLLLAPVLFYAQLIDSNRRHQESTE